MLGLPLALTTCASLWLQPPPDGLSLPPDCLLGQTPGSSRTLHPRPPLNRDRLYQLARQITVKVFVGRNSGSGVMLRRQGNLYTVMTNRHVVNAASANLRQPYLIQTPDGRSHPASLLKKINLRGNDLALLQFRSPKPYSLATYGRAGSLWVGAAVVTGGFPHDPLPATGNGFVLTRGTVSLLPAQALEGGYQLGYTNLIYQGMSGGPVLDSQGNLVGVNSLHAYPLWGDPYRFQDGSWPDAATRSQMVQSSWAVPIERILEMR
jgi:S1-C subfamily serine protease